MDHPLDRGTGEHRVGACGVNLSSALAKECFGGFDQGSSGIDDVINYQGATAANVSDEVHDFAHIDIDSALVYDGQRRIQALGEGAGAFHAARIRRNHSQIWQLKVTEMLDKNG